MNSSVWALNGVNFFMADVRDGLGPYLGVFLQQQKWSPSEIGLVMTIGGVAGMIATTPLGALVDRVHAKRFLMVFAAIATVLASFIIVVFPDFTATTISQVVSGIVGAVIGPAIAGITLGLVKQKGFTHQMGRNEVFNHGGNVAAALLCGLFGYWFGLVAIFYVMAAMALISLVAVWFIDPDEIDYNAARGASGKSGDQVKGLSVLLTCKPLVILALTLLLFHLGNAAMLPLFGQALVAAGAGDPSAYTSATIIVAQLTMIPVALAAAWVADQRGYWLVFVIALLALPVRGAIAALMITPIGLAPVQILDGVGAGILGVAVPGLVARIMAGTGRVNAAIGGVMTVQGLGAALSPALGGALAERFGYSASFLALGAIAFVALMVWIVATPHVADACGGRPAKRALKRA